MQGRNWLVRASGASLLVMSLVLVGCGSDGADEKSAKSPAADTKSSGESTDFASVVSERGEPKLSKVDVPSELKSTDDVEGTGRTVEPGDTVTVQYVGAAASTGEVFESSWSSQPATFSLDSVIQGWSEGLVGMKEGGRRTLVIPADLAYGNGGPAPGDALIFTIDLIGIG